jgi:ATP-binding protein involved in chromosome partitioning
MPFLGEVPLVMVIRETSDAGTPVVASAPESVEAGAYRGIVTALLQASPGLRG